MLVWILETPEMMRGILHLLLQRLISLRFDLFFSLNAYLFNITRSSTEKVEKICMFFQQQGL